MSQLWIGFEKWLLNRYPGTEKIVTPYADPIWNVKEYQSFLKAQGYKKSSSGTFVKLLGVPVASVGTHLRRDTVIPQ